jgi:2-polyprenyl-3-methyl-5-hydroxy-6-metoxy-1,4-benzoquinol methylase
MTDTPQDAEGRPAAGIRLASELRARRELAAAQSKGTSDEPIYALFSRLVTSLRLQGDLLDFGAGMGTLLRRLDATHRFRSVTAADIMKRPPDLSEGVRWVECDLNERVPLPDSSFDVVLSAEVIEHLENPRAIAREWFRLLRPGGTLVVSTPNNESWRALVALAVRGHFVMFGDTSYPAHITALLRKDIERLLVEAHFEAPQFAFSDVGGVVGWPTLKWQSLCPRWLKGVRYSDNVVVWARKTAR